MTTVAQVAAPKSSAQNPDRGHIAVLEAELRRLQGQPPRDLAAMIAEGRARVGAWTGELPQAKARRDEERRPHAAAVADAEMNVATARAALRELERTHNIPAARLDELRQAGEAAIHKATDLRMQGQDKAADQMLSKGPGLFIAHQAMLSAAKDLTQAEADLAAIKAKPVPDGRVGELEAHIAATEQEVKQLESDAARVAELTKELSAIRGG